MMDLDELFAMDDLPDDSKINLDIVSQITRRRRQLLIHSYLYYRMNTNLIEDHQYDEWATDLIRLQKAHPRESERADMHEDFKDFQMGDSFGLPLDQAWIHEKATQLVNYHRKQVGA